MKIVEAISLLRNSIKQYQDDSLYTDQFLYGILKLYRNKYLSRRIKDKFRISDRLKRTYAAPLKIDYSHQVGCLEFGCDVHITTYQIPETLSGKYSDMIKVYTLGYNEIYPVSIPEQRTNQLIDIKKDIITYSFLNRRIVLWNTDTTKLIPAILVDGVWEDETEWEGITYCDSVDPDSNLLTENCFDIEQVEFALEGDFMVYVIKESIEHLGLTLQIQEDLTNNNNPSI